MINQPTKAPTRKWRFAGVAEVITAIGGVLAVGTVEFTADEQAAVVGGVAAVGVVVGRIVAYMTRNGATDG